MHAKTTFATSKCYISSQWKDQSLEFEEKIQLFSQAQDAWSQRSALVSKWFTIKHVKGNMSNRLSYCRISSFSDGKFLLDPLAVPATWRALLSPKLKHAHQHFLWLIRLSLYREFCQLLKSKN